MGKNNKKWTQPQLIILGRGTPEENVLGGCKTASLAISSSTQKAGCKVKVGNSCPTTICSTISLTS